MADREARFVRCDTDNVPCLVVDGDVDLVNVDTFNRYLTHLVADAHSTAVLDLRSLTFFGSTALNAVIAAHQCAEAHRVHLLVRPSPMVLRVVHAAGLDSWLNLGV
jgi:anti-anti-sigma factor